MHLQYSNGVFGMQVWEIGKSVVGLATPMDQYSVEVWFM
jgi:hypothetical protein